MIRGDGLNKPNAFFQGVEIVMIVRIISSAKLLFSALLTAFFLMALSACGFAADGTNMKLDKSELAQYMLPEADYAAVLLNVGPALRESVSTATKDRAQSHIARTFGWLAHKQGSPNTVATKVYALQFSFDEVNQRYQTIYSAAGMADIAGTYSVEGVEYCVLHRNVDGSITWKPKDDAVCVRETCSRYVRSITSQAACRAVNERLELRGKESNQPA